MNTFIKSSIFSAGVALFVLSAHVGSVSAATYYACSSGYKFQVKNNAARCFKAAMHVDKPLLACGNISIPGVGVVGHKYRKDYKGKEDMCVGVYTIGPMTNKNEIEIGCPPGTKKEIRSGQDHCKKIIPAVAKAPTKKVSR